MVRRTVGSLICLKFEDLCNFCFNIHLIDRCSMMVMFVWGFGVVGSNQVELICNFACLTALGIAVFSLLTIKERLMLCLHISKS